MNCPCQTAVLRSYREMLGRGVDAREAFDGAVRVYRFHHPDATVVAALDQVGAWLDEEQA